MSMTTEIVVTLQCDAPYCMRARRFHVPYVVIPLGLCAPESALLKAELLGWGYSAKSLVINRCPFCTEKEANHEATKVP